LAELKKGETFFDLGSGDGRTAIMAAQEFGAKAIGIELRKDLVKKSNLKIEELGLKNTVKIIHNNIFNIDLSPADVVYLYLTTSANNKIRPKLESELKKKTRIVSHDYEIPEWKTIKFEKYCENQILGFPKHTLYLYEKN
jgi:predicted RNA methylase